LITEFDSKLGRIGVFYVDFVDHVVEVGHATIIKALRYVSWW